MSRCYFVAYRPWDEPVALAFAPVRFLNVSLTNSNLLTHASQESGALVDAVRRGQQ